MNMEIKIVRMPITRADALEIGKEFYHDMIKGVVDIRKKIIALGGEYHMDANNVLMAEGNSSQENVWGFNIYPKRTGVEWIEYTALVNIRPAVGNRTMTVENKEIRETMRHIIESLIV